MLNIGVIVGSTRPGRKAAAIATWVHGLLKSRKDAEFEIVALLSKLSGDASSHG
jgi:NAD(P)H-dependent FMN reductase